MGEVMSLNCNTLDIGWMVSELQTVSITFVMTLLRLHALSFIFVYTETSQT